jgi:hypothetical protein
MPTVTYYRGRPAQFWIAIMSRRKPTRKASVDRGDAGEGRADDQARAARRRRPASAPGTRRAA